MPTDAELMAAYVAGDQKAFRQLFDRWAPKLLGMLRRYAHEEADARDLVQQTFLQLHRARNDFKEGMELRPWLLTIAYNLGRDHLRRVGRRREDSALVAEQKDESASPATEVERGERSASLHRALAQLSPEQYDAVVLHWFEGLSFTEIANATGSKVSAVKVRAHRAYRRLKELLDVTDRQERT